MSKLVKKMMIEEIGRRLDGVEEALVVDVLGLDANASVALRRDLRTKDIHVLVVKRSLARVATRGTQLEKAFSVGDGAAAAAPTEGDLYNGSTAIMWGASDFVALAKEVARLVTTDKYKEKFTAKGGVLGGEHLSADDVAAASKWPTREEQLSILSGQILAPGRNLAAALIGPGGALASQVKTKGEDETEGGSA